MAAISDAIVIGIVLGLVFGAVCYYLFSRMTQLERKVGLMENILLDLKVTTEQTLLSVTELPDSMHQSMHQSMHESMHESYNDVQQSNDQENGLEGAEDREDTNSAESRDVQLEQVPRSRGSPSSVQVEKTSVSVNYEAMTYKELTALAKQQGISGLRNMSKAQVIDAIRKHNGFTGSSSDSSLQQEQTELSSWASPMQPLQSFSESNELELGSADANNEGLSLVADLDEGEHTLTLDS